jgi:hypothetical protein
MVGELKTPGERNGEPKVPWAQTGDCRVLDNNLPEPWLIPPQDSEWRIMSRTFRAIFCTLWYWRKPVV